MAYKHLEDCVGNTPLVKIKRLWQGKYVTVLGKLEGNNPAGSVKDRPALNMITKAEARADIKPGDTLIEATSGNTGIALAMTAAMRGYKMVLIMPDNMSEERRASMRAFGAEIISVSQEDGGIEGARDMAIEMQADGKGVVLDQFSNPDNWSAHYESTGPEIWRDTNGEVTHFVSSGESQIPGIRRWPIEYLPKIFDAKRVDRTLDVDQTLAEETMRALATQEGIFAGVSSGGAMACALQVAAELESKQQRATIVSIVCDRGDRYLSTGVY